MSKRLNKNVVSKAVMADGTLYKYLTEVDEEQGLDSKLDMQGYTIEALNDAELAEVERLNVEK